MGKYFQNPELYATKNEDGEYVYNNLPLTPILIAQLKEKYPEKSEAEIKEIAEDRSREFASTCPSFTTWQDFYWPVANGEYCQFLLIAGKSELNELASDGNGEQLFKDSLQDKPSEQNTNALWNSLKDENIIDNGTVDQNWPSLALVFKDITTGKLLIVWDGA
jgi:uncharacterized protein CbrC (UPF0167 family)